MKFGYLSVNHAGGIDPATLGRELESRGFESLWVPEHSHMPVASVSQFPGGDEIPDGYAHAMSPFISLTAAATATTSLTLGTGICLPLEHDLLDLACTTATLDTLSGGRLILGAGVGWNSEELGNHRPELPFKQRYSALEERIAALRAAWSLDPDTDYSGLFADQPWGRQVAEFAGQRDRFTPSWVFPKPEGGAIPVALGLTGPLGMAHTARYGDQWLPVDIALMENGRMAVAERITRFHEVLAENGRAPDDVPITLFVWGDSSAATLEQYIALGIRRLVFAPPTFSRHEPDATLRRLDQLSHIVSRYGTG